MTTRIPGISRILALSAAALPSDLEERDRCGLPVVLACDAVEVPFVDIPECVLTADGQRSGITAGATLSFISSRRPVLPAGPLAWLVYDQHGRATLLGRRHAPHPRLSIEETTGKLSDRAAAQCEVKCITAPVTVSTPLLFISDNTT